MDLRIIHDCTDSVLSFQVQNTKCSDNVCDRQQVSIGKGTCYQMHNRSGNVFISIEVQITIPGGSTFKTFIRSKWFSENFILAGELLPGIRASIFKDYEIGDRLYTYFESVTRYINDLCKFRVIGWAKSGEVQDQGVDQPSDDLPHNAALVMVESDTLNHHITWLEPMRPVDINIDTLNQLKFDVVNGFITK